MNLQCILIFTTSLYCLSSGLPALGKDKALIVQKIIYNNLEELIGTPWQKCGTCICYAETQCQNITNCFNTSDDCANNISMDYWRQAGSPAIFDDMGEQAAYKLCMTNENCILNTIKRYTNSFGPIDCNEDGEYDCRDKYFIHLNGEDNCSKFSRSSNFLLSTCFNRVGIEPLDEYRLIDVNEDDGNLIAA